MTIAIKLFAATAAIAGLAAPAAAQYYPQPQQPYAYPQQQPYAYPQPGYPQQQSGIGGIINQLLGNRYNAPDRTAVAQCAAAAQAQAAAQYRPQGAPYGNAYGYGQANPYGNAYGYNAIQSARVTGITNVERRRNGLRVTGLMSSGMAAAYGQPGYGQQGYGYQGYGQQGYGQGYNPAYANAGSDLTFRCNVDYRGQVTNVRVRRNTAAYGRR